MYLNSFKYRKANVARCFGINDRLFQLQKDVYLEYGL